jgi:hypothetical protein
MKGIQAAAVFATVLVATPAWATLPGEFPPQAEAINFQHVIKTEFGRTHYWIVSRITESDPQSHGLFWSWKYYVAPDNRLVMDEIAVDCRSTPFRLKVTTHTEGRTKPELEANKVPVTQSLHTVDNNTPLGIAAQLTCVTTRFGADNADY